jgi:hypothetical protein
MFVDSAVNAVYGGGLKFMPSSKCMDLHVASTNFRMSNESSSLDLPQS